jgi:long-subunit fatty acid transport protein
MKFTLPSKVGFGVRADIENLGVAMDLEYNFNSQNDEAPILAKSATAGGADLPLANQFRWGDALTLRTGIEYSFKESFKARTGYIFDAKTANEQYPTAFGTPPAATHSITVGGGYTAGPWELNLAYAYRLGSATVTEETLAKAEYDCLPCSKAGDYELALHGVYVDFSYNW